MSAADPRQKALDALEADWMPRPRTAMERGAHWDDYADLARELLAALDRCDELEAELAEWKLKERAMTDYFADASRRADEANAELERLTVGRATLEDQTNRAELAEARAKALEDVAEAAEVVISEWDAANPFVGYSLEALRIVLADTLPAREVLSGGSE